MTIIALIYIVGLQSTGCLTNLNNGTNQMKQNTNNLPIEESISINTSGISPLLTIGYKNISNRSLYLIEDAFPVSIINKSNGETLRDISPRVKRKPYTLDDYIKLEPGNSIEFKHSLNERFNFPKENHTYIVRFYKGYYDPITEENFTGDTKDLEFEWSSL